MSRQRRTGIPGNPGLKKVGRGSDEGSRRNGPRARAVSQQPGQEKMFRKDANHTCSTTF